MTTIGEEVWNRLRAEGGLVHTTADGRKFVRFNRGCKCSPELRDLIKRHSEDLKEFIDVRHAEGDRAWHRLSPSRGVGSSQTLKGNAPNGRDDDARDCNAEMRSNISAETPSKWGFSHRRGISGASIAAALVLSASLAASGEILCVRAAGHGRATGSAAHIVVPVDLVSALLTSSSSGSGEVSTQQTNGGMVWKKN